MPLCALCYSFTVESALGLGLTLRCGIFVSSLLSSSLIQLLLRWRLGGIVSYLTMSPHASLEWLLPATVTQARWSFDFNWRQTRRVAPV